MKKCLSIFLLVIFFINVCVYTPLAIKVNALESENLRFRLNENEKSYLLLGGNQKDIVNLVIPSTYNGLPVTAIANYAFKDYTSLSNITIGDNIISIGFKAFFNTGCYNDSQNWKNDVLYIDNHLIEAKSSISGSYNVKSGTKTIADLAFNGCSFLTGINIPDTVISIGESAFSLCTSLTTIKISDSLIHIEKDAFLNTGYYNDKSNWENNGLYIGDCLVSSDTYNLSGIFNIKDGTRCVADSAVLYYSWNEGVTVPDSVMYIGNESIGYYYDEKYGRCKAENLIIYCTKGSAAEKYATENGFKFVTKNMENLATPVVTVKNSATGVKVTWNKVANAEKYIVYSSSYNTKTKKWSGWTNRGTTTKTTWTDKKVKSGTKYKYTVRSVNGSVKSEYKSSSSILFIAQPTVKIANASTGVKVSWSKVTGATGYTVYKSEYNSKTKKWSNWKNKGTAKANKTSWTDTKVASGVQYKYTVRAINGKVASTYVSSNTVLYLAQPKTTVKAVSNGINVAWTQSAGATGYTVYRMEYNAKTKKWSGWKNMGTAKATKKSWTDKSAKKGVTYRYTVKAVNGKTASSYKASSNVKR